MELEKKILEVELKIVQKKHNKICNTINTTTCLAGEMKQLQPEMKERKTYMTERINDNDQLSKKLYLAEERLKLAEEKIPKLETRNAK
eukprot:11559272-Ditylum_brightwellii.AAC.1